jgi:hypothetical protein
METKALQSTRGHTARPVQLVLVRANGPLFYSIAAAMLLEADVATHAQRLLDFYRSNAPFCAWIETEWLPRKLVRAQELREFVENTWPELDWSAVHDEYHALASRRRAAPSAAGEVLAGCVAAAQSGVFYRCLARWSDDRRLRDMARRYAHEEACSFAQFQSVYDLQPRTHRLGFLTAWRSAFACVRAARDNHVARAFSALSTQCGANVAFNVLGYEEFIVRMRAVIERYGELGTAERILLGSWKSRPRTLKPEPNRPLTPAWFKPLFPAAA